MADNRQLTFRAHAPLTYSTFPAYSVKPEHQLLDVCNYSGHRTHMLCWIKKLLTYLSWCETSRGRTGL